MEKSYFDTIPGVVKLDSRVVAEDIENHAAEIVTICHKIKNEMKQEAISLEFDGELFLV